VRKTEKEQMYGVCSTYGGEQRCVQGFGGKPEVKRPLGRPRHRREDNIKMGFQEWFGVAWNQSI